MRTQNKLAALWDPCTCFNASFLAKNHPLVLQDTFNRVIAFLLFPPICTCKIICVCDEERESVIFTLNTDLYNTLYSERVDQLEGFDAEICTAKLLLKIPEDNVFRKLYARAYPLWRMQEEFEGCLERDYFQMVSQLTWTLVDSTTSAAEHYPYLIEIVEEMLGEVPAIKKEQSKEELTRNEEYLDHFSAYRSVCHFIAALGAIQEDDTKNLFEQMKNFSSEQITKFLDLSYSLRQGLLKVSQSNPALKNVLTEETLMPLPSWMHPTEKQESSLTQEKESLPDNVIPFGRRPTSLHMHHKGSDNCA